MRAGDAPVSTPPLRPAGRFKPARITVWPGTADPGPASRASHQNQRSDPPWSEQTLMISASHDAQTLPVVSFLTFASALPFPASTGGANTRAIVGLSRL